MRWRLEAGVFIGLLDVCPELRAWYTFKLCWLKVPPGAKLTFANVRFWTQSSRPVS